MKTRRINKQCLSDGHDWDYFGHPNFVCSRKGCSVRADDFGGIDVVQRHVPATDLDA